jgi:hypothetical protein
MDPYRSAAIRAGLARKAERPPERTDRRSSAGREIKRVTADLRRQLASRLPDAALDAQIATAEENTSNAVRLTGCTLLKALDEDNADPAGQGRGGD